MSVNKDWLAGREVGLAEGTAHIDAVKAECAVVRKELAHLKPKAAEWLKRAKKAEQKIKDLKAEVLRLQNVIDNRPAINAGLPETYIMWSQSIYTMDYAHTREVKQ